MSGSHVTSRRTRYRERLWVSWWWWPLGFVGAAAMAHTVTLALRDLPTWVPFAALFAVASGVLLWLGRFEVAVVESDAGPELWAGDAHLPASVITRLAEVPRSAKSAALGRQLDPAAFVMHRGWVGPMVLVVLDDPDDPTPYWLVSCRHPDRVRTALQS